MPEELNDQRRLECFKQIYQHMPHWHAQMEMGTMSDIITIPDSGEEIAYGDLLAGLADLTDRERQVFNLVCFQGYTQAAAAKLIPHVPGHPISEVYRSVLTHMVGAYDDVQAGLRGKRTLKVEEVSAVVEVMVAELHPIAARHLAAARDEMIARQEDDKTRIAVLEQEIAERQHTIEMAREEIEEMNREIPRVEALLAGVPVGS